jgi:predicted secreted hydrolase
LLVLTACSEPPAPAESDFAVLAAAAPGYAEALPGTAIVFPRDHGPHPGFRIEWWYLTANLEDANGRQLGAQWTLFRLATQPPGSPSPENPWLNPQMYMAHFALSWPGGHRAWQRYARGGDHAGMARAGVTAEPFAAWLDDWRLASAGSSWLPLELGAESGSWGLSLALDSDRAPVLQGDRGFSQKHPDGGGSYYYSQPFLRAGGELRLDGEVVPVTGQAWLDREWSSQFLQGGQAGWDWFALHLDSGEKLMLFQLRSSDENRSYRHAALIRPDGGHTVADSSRAVLEPLESFTVAGRELPLRWRIALPDLEREIEVRPLHPEQWMNVDFPYWEGVVIVRGKGPGNSGRGYMELTGYPLTNSD